MVFGETGKSLFPACLSQPGFVEGVRFRLWVERSRGDFEELALRLVLKGYRSGCLLAHVEASESESEFVLRYSFQVSASFGTLDSVI